MAKSKPSLRTLALLGLIGGLPTIAGAWFGGLIYSAVLAVACLGLGAGAIAQVVIQISGQITAGQSAVNRLASRAPWDHDVKLNASTNTTVGNNARTAESWLDAGAPGPTQFRPASPKWCAEWRRWPARRTGWTAGIPWRRLTIPPLPPRSAPLPPRNGK